MNNARKIALIRDCIVALFTNIPDHPPWMLRRSETVPGSGGREKRRCGPAILGDGPA
jgi:hypothetical protein